MSSFIAHALVGASCFVITRPKTFHQALPLVLVAALLGMSPDVDYLLLWLADWRPNPRVTHSLAFVVSSALGVWLLVRVVLRDKAGIGLLLIFLAAASSHLVLDALVGTTRNPMIWPVVSEGFTSPIGVLPSSGKLDLSNYYFWRNLLIELGIIIPLLLLSLSAAGAIKRHWARWEIVPFATIFIVSLLISLSLSR